MSSLTSSYLKYVPLHTHIFIYCAKYFLKDFIYLFSGRGEGKEKEKEKEKERNNDVWEKHWLVVSCSLPTGDLALNPGMCPDRESNRQPFSLQGGTQSTEPYQPGLNILYIFYLWIFSVMLGSGSLLIPLQTRKWSHRGLDS